MSTRVVNAVNAANAVNLVSDLKAHARVLHRSALRADPKAVQRMRVLPELAKLSDAAIAEQLKRRQCLAAVAKQLGFLSWAHAKDVLTANEQHDFGTLLYPRTCHGHWNIWSAAYDEAREIRAAHGGYLLAYRRQFMIVESNFIDSMGLDPNDPDWERMARDWVRPPDIEARQRLYRQLVHNTLVTWVLEST
jgi:hypothetical protein